MGAAGIGADRGHGPAQGGHDARRRSGRYVQPGGGARVARDRRGRRRARRAPGDPPGRPRRGGRAASRARRAARGARGPRARARGHDRESWWPRERLDGDRRAATDDRRTDHEGGTMTDVLIACSHGTDDARGRAAVATIVADVARLAADVDVREAFVDVQDPSLVDVAAATRADEDVVIVPLLLSAGFHTYVDIAEAAQSSGATAAGALGPDDRLVDLLVERLHEAGARPDDAVILAAAGSSDARAIEAVETMLAQVRARWAGDVTVAYGGVEPRVPDVVAQVRAAAAPGTRV